MLKFKLNPSINIGKQYGDLNEASPRMGRNGAGSWVHPGYYTLNDVFQVAKKECGTVQSQLPAFFYDKVLDAVFRIKNQYGLRFYPGLDHGELVLVALPVDLKYQEMNAPIHYGAVGYCKVNERHRSRVISLDEAREMIMEARNWNGPINLIANELGGMPQSIEVPTEFLESNLVIGKTSFTSVG